MSSASNSFDQSRVVIGLNAVIAAVEKGKPLALCTSPNAQGAQWALPYGPFDPVNHRTFELGLRAFVKEQTSMKLGYVEQLYTFGDRGRAVLAGGSEADHIVSVGYLALSPEAISISLPQTSWRSWYDHFPWEDWRTGEPSILKERITPALSNWVLNTKDQILQRTRKDRVRVAFGFNATGWEEERTLDRYELLYEAGIVSEAARDKRVEKAVLENVDTPMISDHRRILATAIGRLRGKLRYRPVIFEMMPTSFTLLSLQQSVEAIIGFGLHKQNFRRGIDQSSLVIKTSNMSAETGGRPAALFQVDRTHVTGKAAQDRTIKGLTLPRLRQSPTGRIG